MYETHFGLKTRPFRAGPDPVSYYPSTIHEEALARLLQAVREEEGLGLLIGPPGTGKTLLGHVLAERLGSEAACAFLINSHVPDRAGLLQAILFDLALPYEDRSEQELRLSLTEYLLSRFGEGRRTVLVVDEAQHLGPDLLEELRLVGNLESGAGQALHVVLMAQPALLDQLKRPELSGFRQRLAVRVRLEPLDVHEAADYLLHHLRVAGGRPEKLFSDEALEVLARGTQGIPRVLNQAAHQALCLAYGIGAAGVDVEAALEALALLGLDAETPPEDTSFPCVLATGEAGGEGGPALEAADVPAGEDESAAVSLDKSTIEWKPPFGRTGPGRRPA
jgi:type II secretory pathway predicted ATPase ExeA